MIGQAPKYTRTKYFAPEPMWHLTGDAPERLKREFELDMNAPELTKAYKESYPDIENPFYTWEGKIVDKN